jgi:hypothetical protein
VGRDFLFHETIPKSETERGYLRVTKTSLWWQQREFPGVWTTEGLSFCMEKGYIWSINSSTWNHLQALWQGTPLEMLRSILRETQHQDRIETGGYLSPTWRILRELKPLNETKVVVGESAVTAVWESLDEEEQAKCWKVLEQEKGWVVWCRANLGPPGYRFVQTGVRRRKYKLGQTKQNPSDGGLWDVSAPGVGSFCTSRWQHRCGHEISRFCG